MKVKQIGVDCISVSCYTNILQTDSVGKTHQ